jgi:hypothetical protein
MPRKKREPASKAAPESNATAELGGNWTPDGDILAEIGDTGLNRSGGTINEERHRHLSGSRAAARYREMYDEDAVIGAICYATEILMLGAKWYVEPAKVAEPQGNIEGETAEDRLKRFIKARADQKAADETAAFVEGCWDDMEHTSTEFRQQVLSMVPYGWSFFETVYKRRSGPDATDKTKRSRFRDGKIGWRKIALRSQDSLERWEFDEDGDLIALWQAPPEGGRYRIPLTKACHFRIRGNKGSPEGRSMLRNAHRSWWLKKRLEEVEGIGYERNLNGLPVAEVPPEMLRTDAPAAAKAILAIIKTLVQNVRTDERMGVVFPASEYTDAAGVVRKTGFKFTLASSSGRNGAEIGAAISRYRADIAMTMLAQFILLGMDKVGSFSLSSDQTALFARALGAILDIIAEEINRQLIPPLMRLNGIPEELWPKMCHGDVEARPLAEFATAMQALVGSGLVTPDAKLEERIREENGLPEMAPDTAAGAEEDWLPPTTAMPEDGPEFGSGTP